MARRRTQRRPKRVSLKAAARSLRQLAPHLKAPLRRERRLLVGGTLALFGEVAMRLAEPWPLSYIIDGIVAATGSSAAGRAPADLGALIAYGSIALLAISGMKALFAYLKTVSFALAGNRVLTAVRSDLFRHLQSLPMAYHDAARTGDLVTRVTSDVGRLKETSVTAMLPLFGNVVTLIGMLTVVICLDWRLALVLVLVLPLFLLAGRSFSTRIHVVSRRQRKAEGNLAARATEVLASMRVVQTYTLEERMNQGFSASNTASLRQGVKAKRLAAGLERFTDCLVALGIALVLYSGAHHVLDGTLTPGELTVFLTYLKTAFRPLRDVAKYTGRIAQAGASSERILDVFAMRPLITDGPSARPLPAVRGQVHFDGVWLSYVPGHPVLRGLDLTIGAGERVAIVGTSGVGKSTLVALLTRLRDPDLGAVRIDGVDLREVTLHSVRSQIAVVLQDSVLFSGTIAQNIAHGAEDAAPERIEWAARLAGAHDFIEALADGYETRVGERGATLSGGQRQRIAIARAAIRGAPIVILDEAMAGLDPLTERSVLEAMDRLTRGRTTLVITHDDTVALGCDRVVTLAAGQVAAVERPASATEWGTP